MELTFLLKKIVTMFIMPFPIAMLLLAFGLLLLYRHKYSKAKIAFTSAVLWLFLISYSPLVNAILYQYEATYPALHTAPSNIKYIYILGGGSHTDEALPITSQVVEASVVRVTEAIRLYQQLDEKPIIIVSGYSGLHDPTPGAVMQKRLALALGVKKDKLHMEPTPKDTQDEAVVAKKYIGDTPFIVVTSASHMKRAMKFFENEGLHPIAAPTNHLADVKYPNYTDFFSATALRKTNVVWHEMLGLLWQKIKGI